MGNSLIIGFVSNAYKKLKLYYESSLLHSAFDRLSEDLRKGVSGSSIIVFFDREWKIEDAWRNSLTFRVLTLPVRFYEKLSDILSFKTKGIEEGSAVIGSIKRVLKDIFNINSRVLGLLILSFSVTQGLMDMISNRVPVPAGLQGMVRTALFLVGALLVLVNRPLSALYEGSFTARIAADFFKVRGLKDGTGNK